MITAPEITFVITHHSLMLLDMMEADPTIPYARLVWIWMVRPDEIASLSEAFNGLSDSFLRFTSCAKP